ncbi:hypothetical protein FGG08_004685 [Glutinoglossum americanum]|uniref:Protein kinase domain-containing protein n=1 Tax=Glutinoglossum americanum TaxID=1670608 RepID=A0A9P8I6Z8_9PEZI|nr:hypothetical protein FGG08_004685 [Glutinoglossum americanum]
MDGGIAPAVPSSEESERPPILRHLSAPAYKSPTRHHTRTHSAPREVKAVKEFSKSRLRKRAQSHILRRPGPGRRPGHLAAGNGLNSPLHRRSASDVHKDEEAGNPLYLIREEIAIMKKLNHNNLVQLIEVLDDPEEDSLYMVLEMCKKGVIMKVGLDERSDCYDDEDCRCWFRDLILGIEYSCPVHAQGVVHRDIKPDNLLLTSENVLKIVDFGVSEMFEKESEMLTAKSAGSPAFLPPELCVARHGEISGKAADIWSMGVTLYCLRFGKLPFEKIGVMDLYEAIRNDVLTYPPDTDPDFVDSMERLLEKDPAKRIKMPELREHPWVTKGGTDRLLSSEENTADLVELPTDAELKDAITSNIKHAMVVMKAVKQFKNLIFKKRPHLIDGMLGEEIRIVHPPRSMSPPGSSSGPFRSRSLGTGDRRSVEQTLSSGGVRRDADASSFTRALAHRMDSAVAITDGGISDGSETSGVRSSLGHTVLSPSEATPAVPRPVGHREAYDSEKEQAHDPLGEDPLYLNVGPGGDDAHLKPSYVVSESPPATDINVYETAYREEVERIRQKQGKSATVYLTRRVEALVSGESGERDTAARKEKALVSARGEMHNAQ